MSWANHTKNQLLFKYFNRRTTKRKRKIVVSEIYEYIKSFRQVPRDNCARLQNKSFPPHKFRQNVCTLGVFLFTSPYDTTTACLFGRVVGPTSGEVFVYIARCVYTTDKEFDKSFFHTIDFVYNFQNNNRYQLKRLHNVDTGKTQVRSEPCIRLKNIRKRVVR